MYSIFDTEKLEEFRKLHKLQPFRIRQILLEIFKNSVLDFDQMTTLSKELREEFKKTFYIVPLKLKDIIIDGQTAKFSLETQEGLILESVLMFHFDKKGDNKEKINRLTVCISSQVGCPVGCIFCVTGKLGLLKNLSRDEILGQVLIVNNYIKTKFGKKEDGTWNCVRNVVFMGMGEPLFNYDAVKKSSEYMMDVSYLGLGRRHVTVSTSGVVPGLKRLIEDELPVSLAFSLHSADQVQREELIPTIAKTRKLDELMPLMNKYAKISGNNVFYEYVLLKGINDREEDAHKVGKLLKNQKAHLNLIPYNQNPAIDLEEPTEKAIRTFQDIVIGYKVPVTVRENMGRKSKSACGQLGRDALKKKLELEKQS